MENFELLPTKENIIDAYLNDYLGRRPAVLGMVDMLLGVPGNYSIALDGAWGSGKTFFIKQVEMVLAASNPYIENIYADSAKRINGLIPAETADKLSDHLLIPIYYDAWENDNDYDPILSLVLAAFTQLKEEESLQSVKVSSAKILNDLIKRLTTIDLRDLVDVEDILQTLKSEKSLKDMIDELFNGLLSERGFKLVFFIDELDRCKPTYAVQVLERIKHYFANPNIIFVFSVNLAELQHTVGQCYGSDFDSGRYLDRFFNRKFNLPAMDSRLLQQLHSCHLSGSLEEVCNTIGTVFRLEIRDSLKFFAMIDEVNDKLRLVSDHPIWRTPYLFIQVLMIPVAYALHIQNPAKYREFVSGNDVKILLQVVSRLRSKEDILTWCALNRGETFDKSTADMSSIDMDERISELYAAITSKETILTEIGGTHGLHVDEQVRKRFVALLSIFSIPH